MKKEKWINEIWFRAKLKQEKEAMEKHNRTTRRNAI